MQQMADVWLGLAYRFLRARPIRACLTSAAILLGAALLSGVLTLGATLEAAVIDQMRDQFGTYDLMVAAPAIATDVLDPDTVATLGSMEDVAYAVPLLIRPGAGDQSPVGFYSGVGLFPPGEQGLRLLQGRLPEAGETVLPTAVADRLGVALGGQVVLPFPGGDRTLRLVGLVRGAGPATALLPYEWLRQELRLDGPSVLLVGLRPGAKKLHFAAEVQATFPELNLDLRRHVDDWRNNLGGFGLLGRLLGGAALIAGCLLVVGAFGIAVQERTRELALLRAVGASRSQVARLLLAEALLLGAVGASGGVLLGVLSAAGLLDAVSQRVGIPVHSQVVPTAGLCGVWAATLLLSLAGAWPAAARAGGTTPMAALQPDRRADERRIRAGLWGSVLLLLLAAAAVLYSFQPGLEVPQQFMLGVLAALLLLVAVLAGLAWLLPRLTGLLAAAVRRWLPVHAAVAQRSLERHRGRAARTAGVMILGLAALVSLVALLTTEAASREQNLRATFPTEAQVTGPWGTPRGYREEVIRQVKAVPGIADAIPLGREVEAELVGYDADRARPDWVEQMRRNGQAPERIWLQPLDFAALGRVYSFGRVSGTLDGGVVMTEQLADEMGLKLGDLIRLRLAGETAEHALTVAALVERLPVGLVVAVDAEKARQQLGISTAYRITLVQLAQGASRTVVRDAVQAILGARYAAFTYQDLTEVLSERRRRTQETLAMVMAAAIILLAISAVGLVNTVTAAMNERRRELALIRAVGATPGQAVWLILLEMTLLGIAASFLGVGLGLAMATLIWLHGTLAGQGVMLPWVTMLAGVLTGPVLAGLAALPPIRRTLLDSPSRAMQAE